MFSKGYELRYSDRDCDGKIKISSVIDLLQDVSIAHSDSVGLDDAKYRELRIACLLANWRIKFIKNIVPSKSVTVKTGIMKLTSLETYRKYEVWQNGECAVIATALWFTVNTETMRICRDTEKIFSVFECVTEEDNNLPCDKLRLLENAICIGGTTVEQRDIDTNKHMNNVKSIEVALNYISKADIEEIQVKYRKEIKWGKEIKIYADEKNSQLEIRNSKEEVCVLLYLEK